MDYKYISFILLFSIAALHLIYGYAIKKITLFITGFTIGLTFTLVN